VPLDGEYRQRASGDTTAQRRGIDPAPVNDDREAASDLDLGRAHRMASPRAPFDAPQ